MAGNMSPIFSLLSGILLLVGLAYGENVLVATADNFDSIV